MDKTKLTKIYENAGITEFIDTDDNSMEFIFNIYDAVFIHINSTFLESITRTGYPLDTFIGYIKEFHNDYNLDRPFIYHISDKGCCSVEVIPENNIQGTLCERQLKGFMESIQKLER